MQHQELTIKKYVFEFEQSPSIKSTCPQCLTTHSFRHYKTIPREFGICDHKNKCNYHNNPSEQTTTIKRELYKLVGNSFHANETIVDVKKILYPTTEQLNVLENLQSNFHHFCLNTLKLTKEHLQKWNVGTNNNGNTAFVFQTLSGKHINIKFMNYSITPDGKDCKRDKKVNFYLVAKDKTKESYELCLFGEHLLTDKIICLVESEKTAVISSFFYPQYDWLATGGSNGLTVKKVQLLKDKHVYYIGDNDKAGNENSTLKKLDSYNINFEKIHFDIAKEGEDLADIIIRGELPDLIHSFAEPTTENQQGAISQQQQQQQTKDVTTLFKNSKNISDFEKVENFITERYDIRNNIVSNKIEFRVKHRDSNDFKELNENNVFRELQKNFISFSINKLKSMLGSDFVEEYNPFVHYFENLPSYQPSVEPDYILKLTSYIPVKDKARFETQFKKMLVRSIACSLHNVINKQAFVLVHDQQNSGKTTFLRWLNPPALKHYIAENINTDKDSLIAMCTNFIINMDELATLNKAEINALKSIMSKDVFKGRLPYGAREVNLTRRANIIGSTNNTEFLSDDTGSVRWLCFELADKLNFDYKKDIDINSIWAQAYHLYKNGFKYELTPSEIAENETVNANHRIITTEQELIQATFAPSSKNALGSIFKCATEIKIILAEKYPTEKLSNLNNIGKALRVLGFQKESSKIETDKPYPIKGYYVTFKPAYYTS